MRRLALGAASAIVVTACTLGSLDGLSGGAYPDEGGAPDAIAEAAPDAGIDAPFEATIAWRDTQNEVIGNGSFASFTVVKPTGTAQGDLLIGVLFMGQTAADSILPVVTPPPGWSLLRRIDHMNVSSLVVFLRQASADEPPQYTFAIDRMEEGVAWVSAYSGVDPDRPVASDIPLDQTGPSATFSTSAITTDVVGAVVVGAICGHGTTGTWTPPSATTARMNMDNDNARAGLGFDVPFPAGAIPAMVGTFSATENYGLTHVLVLRPRTH